MPRCYNCRSENPNQERCHACDGCTGHDAACCRCVDCPNCGDTNTIHNTCDGCERFRCCCDCERCENCGGTSSPLCPTGCGRCEECGCKCTIVALQPPFQYVAYDPAFAEPNKKGYSRNPVKRFLAAEIEIAEVADTSIIMDVCRATRSSTVRDGSLPAQTGFEITTQPHKGDAWVSNLEKVCWAADAARAKVDKTCGVHVHADARDITELELVKIIRLYAHLEPALHSLIPPKRRVPANGNWYTAPVVDRVIHILGDSHRPGHQYSRFTTQRRMYSLYGDGVASPSAQVKFGERLREVKSKKYNENRYYGLNIHSYYYRKTLECRILEGTIDPDVISNWGMLFATIIEFGRCASHTSIMGLPLNSYERHRSRHTGGHDDIHKWVSDPLSFAGLMVVLGNNGSLREFCEKRRVAFGDAVQSQILRSSEPRPLGSNSDAFAAFSATLAGQVPIPWGNNG